MSADRQTALVIGASRALGLAMVAELADRGWAVIGTVRGEGRTACTSWRRAPTGGSRSSRPT